jgi:alanyl-tRNA synthetase
MGAVAFFGDKYGDRVRVVRAGVHSLEFCGGTHVDRLGTIGTISVLSEASIGAGVRRVEATTGFVSIARAREAEATIREAAALLKAEPEQLSAAITRQIERAKALENELTSLRRSQIDALATKLASEATSGKVISRIDGYGSDDIRSLVQALRSRGVAIAIVASANSDGKVAVGVASDGSLDAGATCKQLAPLVGGGGGGAKDLAVAGGRDASGIEALLTKAAELAGA